jgi:hypothetical protein
MKPEIFSVTFPRGTKMILRCLTWVCIFLTTLFCSLGRATDVSLFAGGEIDDHSQGFSFIGVDITQGINETVAIAGRVMPNYLTYKYYNNNVLIKAKSPGLFAVAGIKLFSGQSTFGVYGGAEFRNTDLDPDDRNSSQRGSTSAAVIQGEFDTWLTKRTNFYIFGSYSDTSNFSYERAKLKYQITNLDHKDSHTLFIGAEQFYGRNSDFRGQGYGALLELYFIPLKASIGVRGGYKHDSTYGNGAYGGLELYKGF